MAPRMAPRTDTLKEPNPLSLRISSYGRVFALRIEGNLITLIFSRFVVHWRGDDTDISYGHRGNR